MNLVHVDGGDALFKVAAEITGEAGLKRDGRDAHGAIAKRTASMVAALANAIDARCELAIESRMRRIPSMLGGDATVRADVAPVVRQVKGEVGDRFERVEGLLIIATYDVVEVLSSGTRVLKSSADDGVYHATLDTLRDPAIFRFVSSAADRAQKERYVAADPANVRNGDGIIQSHADKENATVSPEDVVSDDGADPDARVGNLRTAAEMLKETDAAIADLIRVWNLYETDAVTCAYDAKPFVEALAKCAGLPVPWLRP